MREKPIALSKGQWEIGGDGQIYAEHGPTIARMSDLDGEIDLDEYSGNGHVMCKSKAMYHGIRKAIATRDRVVEDADLTVYQALQALNDAIEQLVPVIDEIEEAAG